MKRNIRKLAGRVVPAVLLAGALFVPELSQAKPASHKKFTVTQPDGTVLELRKRGDEYGHVLLTADGVPVKQVGEGYYYLTLDAQGAPAVSPMLAAPADSRSPEAVAFLKSNPKSGVLDRMMRNAQEMRASRAATSSATRAASPKKGPGLSQQAFPSDGEKRCLAILVEYQDVKFKTKNANDYFDRALNMDGFSDNGATGSVREYFVENSMGQFSPHFDVYGPVTLPHNMKYYGGNDRWGNDSAPEQMVIDACKALDADIDFSIYDYNGDRTVDNIAIFYAGYGEADYNDGNTVWPHSWDISQSSTPSVVLDGVKLDHYICCNELDGHTSKPDGIGTFTHEFSHALGLPDLYCTEYFDSVSDEPFTPGSFSILDYGPYNNNGNTPPNYSAYERYALGWLEPEVLSDAKFCKLGNLAETNKAYIIKTEKANEYFLIENRQQTGNDEYIPAHGMLVWHVDFVQRIFDQNIVNNNKNHQYVDLIEADGVMTEHSRNCDAFPGLLYVNELNDKTYPAMKAWSGKSTGMGLYDIFEDEDGTVSFIAARDGQDVNAVESLPGSDASAPRIEGRTLIVSQGTAEVFDLTGRKITTVQGSYELPAAGVYIVRTSEGTVKLMAR